MLKAEYSLSMTVARAEQVKRLLPDFEQYYSTIQTETMLENAQHAFRSFWTTKILDKNAKDLDELEDMDPMIRLFDSAGKRRYEYKTKEERETLRVKLIQGGNQYGLVYKRKDQEVGRFQNKLISEKQLERYLNSGWEMVQTVNSRILVRKRG